MKEEYFAVIEISLMAKYSLTILYRGNISQLLKFH